MEDGWRERGWSTELGRATDIGRTMWGAAIRLAVVLSTAAAVSAAVLDAIGAVSQTAMVLAVIVIGFTTSWIRTGQVARCCESRHAVRRAMTVPVRSVHLPVS